MKYGTRHMLMAFNSEAKVLFRFEKDETLTSIIGKGAVILVREHAGTLHSIDFSDEITANGSFKPDDLKAIPLKKRTMDYPFYKGQGGYPNLDVRSSRDLHETLLIDAVVTSIQKVSKDVILLVCYMDVKGAIILDVLSKTKRMITRVLCDKEAKLAHIQYQRDTGEKGSSKNVPYTELVETLTNVIRGF